MLSRTPSLVHRVQPRWWWIVVGLSLLVVGLIWHLAKVGTTTWQSYQSWPECHQALIQQADVTHQTSAQLTECVSQWRASLQAIDENWLARHLAVWYLQREIQLPAADLRAWLHQLPADLKTLQSEIMTGEHRYVVLLQNSHELRATGGFPGNIAIIEIKQGRLHQIQVVDIFAPAGQMTTYREPPTGIKEYVSGGNGWRLPDANWSPDFPSSSQTILSFLSESGWQDIDGVIAVNSSVVQKILAIVGPIWLPDYQQTITAENVIDQARADRVNFFPGSYQKPQFLQNLGTHLRLTMAAAPRSQQRQLIQLAVATALTKDWQLYSRQPDLQAVWQRWGLAGAWQAPMQPEPAISFGWIESNVGINKANRGIDRSLDLSVSDQNLVVRATITNSNPPPRPTEATVTAQINPGLYSQTGHYVNYQRLWVSPHLRLSYLRVGEKPLTNWDTQLITLPSGQTVQELGWIMTVAESTQQTVELTFDLASNFDQSNQHLWIWKQSGIPATTYRVSYHGQRRQFELLHDQVIMW